MADNFGGVRTKQIIAKLRPVGGQNNQIALGFARHGNDLIIYCAVCDMQM